MNFGWGAVYCSYSCAFHILVGFLDFLCAGSGAHSQCEDMCEKLISIQKLIYESFSKRIRKALEEYKDKVITEAEYLAKMRSIMEDYRYWL